MNTGLVIGAGGTGKWVATYVKRAAIDYHNRVLLRQHGEAARQLPEFGQLPPEIDLVVVDVDASPVALKDAWHESFQLDFGKDSPEFCPISSSYGAVIESIQRGTGSHDYPLIARWLSQDDANCYNVDTIGHSSLGGAGQLRQLGRLSLFVRLQSDQALLNRIAEACRTVAANWDGRTTAMIFVVGSLAGGTGSGTLIDIAALVNLVAPASFGDNYEVIGLVVLPTTFFNITTMAGDEMGRMQANAYAGLRELMRFAVAPGGYEIVYTSNVTARLTRPLFSVAYLVEGSKRGEGLDLSSSLPQEGTNPAIADAVMLHLTHPVDYRQIKTSKMQRPQGAFSVLGTTQVIFPAEEMILEFGHVLSHAVLEALRWGRHIPPDGRAEEEAAIGQVKNEALDRRNAFFEEAGRESTALLRWVRVMMSAQRKPQLHTPVMLTQLRLNDADLDRQLPTLQLSDVVDIAPFGSIGDPKGVKARAEEKVAATMGGERDELQRSRRTVHGVLNHYRAVHRERFRAYLGAALVDALNESGGEVGKRPRRGGLLLVCGLVASLREYLVDFKQQVQDVYKSQNLIPGDKKTRLDRATEELGIAEKEMLADEGWLKDHLDNHGEQEDYLRCKQRDFDLTVQDAVLGTITSIVDDFVRITGEYGSAVDSWASLLRDDVAALEVEIAAIRRRRRESGRVKVHRYLTEPEDALESELLARYAGVQNPIDLVGGKAVERILSQMEWLWDPSLANPILIKEPAIPGRPASSKRDDWEFDGVRRILEASYQTFAPIRQITLWEALAKRSTSVEQFRSELAQRSAPITSVDDQEQGRNPAIQSVDQAFFLARWEVAKQEDPSDSPRRLSADLQATLGNDARTWDDPHRILGVSFRHLIKMTALGCLPAMRPSYERLLTGHVAVEGTERRVPLYVFPGEQLAAQLEMESLELLNEEVTIPTELVGLLERGDELGHFARALAFEELRSRRDRGARGSRLIWFCEAVLEDGRPQTVEFGTTAIEACRAFVDPPGPHLRQARDLVMARVHEKAEALSDKDYGDYLKARSRGRIIPEGDAAETALREGLDRCLRMLLRRHAAMY